MSGWSVKRPPLDDSLINLITDLREARRAKGITQDILAEKLHVSRQAVQQWEKMVRLPSVENLARWAALFDRQLKLSRW